MKWNAVKQSGRKEKKYNLVKDQTRPKTRRDRERLALGKTEE
jgi:hypothetical protein